MQIETVSKPLRFALSKTICRSLRNTANRKGDTFFSLALFPYHSENNQMYISKEKQKSNKVLILNAT
jgi:hypothetical protein